MLTIILLLIASYLLGAIPFGLWIGKIFFKKISMTMAQEILEQPILLEF